jgi:hypothetical protein
METGPAGTISIALMIDPYLTISSRTEMFPFDTVTGNERSTAMPGPPAAAAISKNGRTFVSLSNTWKIRVPAVKPANSANFSVTV